MKKISILGCGWLGWPLAKAFQKQGYALKLSTTHADKAAQWRADGWDVSEIDIYQLPAKKILEHFLNSDVLCVTVPFRRNLTDPFVYPKALQVFLSYRTASLWPWMVFTSSTGIYSAHGGVCTEESLVDRANLRSRALEEAEQLFLENGVVLRLGGLWGPGREPGLFHKDRAVLKDGGQPVNLVHQDDVVNVMLGLMKAYEAGQAVSGQVFNVVSDGHPTRQEFYYSEALKWGVEPPVFAESGPVLAGKVVSNAKIKAILGYHFQHNLLR